jgi:hypothetical protein
MRPPPPLQRRETRSNGTGKVIAGEDFALYSVEDVQDAAAAGKEGDKRPPPPGRRGTRSSGARKYTAVEAARARIIVASEDFAPLPLLCPVGL